MGEPGGQVPASVVEFAAQSRAGNRTSIPVALQRTFGDIQRPAYLFAVQSPVVLRWSQTAFQTLGKGRQVFHPFEKPLPTPLPDTYNLFHNLLFCLVRHSNNPSLWVALCVDGDAEYSAVPDPKGTAFHLFPVYESLFLQACTRITRAAPQKFRSQSDVAVVGVGWRREGGQTRKELSDFRQI